MYNVAFMEYLMYLIGWPCGFDLDYLYIFFLLFHTIQLMNIISYHLTIDMICLIMKLL